jgi:hypothetical protein
MMEKMPKRIIADRQAPIRQFLEQSSQREIGLLDDARTNPIPFARHNVRPAPPIFSAAGLPIARWRCDHFTTLATLTMNVLAAERQDWPEATAATTRSRRSKD